MTLKIKNIFFAILLAGCSPTPVITPPTSKLLALDSFNHPAQDTENWKKSVTRTVFQDQTTGFVVKGELCLLAGKAFKLLPIEIKNPSAKEYKAGTYYDAMVPLTATNCSNAVYAWMEVSTSQEIEGLSFNIKRLNKMAGDPTTPLFIQLDPYLYTKGIHKGVYKDNTENLALSALQMLVDHRIQPMKSWVTPYKKYSDKYGFKEYVHDFSKKLVNIPSSGDLSLLNSDITKYNIDRPWIYLVDEPDSATLKKLKSEMTSLKAKLPSTSIMVTTTLQKDFPIDIYCPVAEHLGGEYLGAEAYKRLWLYISCMSHGCGENRDWTSGKYTHVEYPRTGTPDLTIDAPLDDSFRFQLLAIKYGLEGLLYYNSIEQWALVKYGVDVFEDQYNFGGNGDGTLLYPDYEKLQPLPSLRLKMLREASFFVKAVEISGSTAEFKEKITGTKNVPFQYSDRERIYNKL